ncbi:uncharacterized protein PGTG_11527 [Puccinia graminis f. sp. tritici CRL 75-36-700-3]|uniref:Uncharacterized protein n=1 Tax=Puccinia graminis f. sp. tritici (strain CRL 75-36-700-3 / race SCCL) TaxID=418459 RepID=E3KM09_PUCGT|nr:uncharacterized protein PGTG_11527 [Puccinia graminis f. sp. tritici CRL 75-36-700-3]EFP85358.1 hypothetical protein PGTG_11527 [Puccinia graminis f. sp. tritici CRL 75-36-700-3]
MVEVRYSSWRIEPKCLARTDRQRAKIRGAGEAARSKKQKSKTSAGIEEKFLRGERSDSEDPETSEQPRKSGGLNEFMKNVKQRASQGCNISRELEWECKPNMGVSR